MGGAFGGENGGVPPRGSGERGVGGEGRSRGGPDPLKKKKEGIGFRGGSGFRGCVLRTGRSPPPGKPPRGDRTRWRPSQGVRSGGCDSRAWENRRHSRGLAGNGRVFGEENRALPTEGGVLPDESLLHEFSISGL